MQIISNSQHIAVGVILDRTEDKVLLAKRPDNAHQAGLWEFPGGKVLPGEDILAALNRELFEELHITVNQARPLITIVHDYPDISVKLDVWLVTDWQGSPYGREGQETEWVVREELGEREFPAANYGIVTAVNLPSLYWITPDLEEYDHVFFERARAYLEAGIKLIQFRCKQLEHNKIKDQASRLIELCSSFNSRLVVNSSPDIAESLGAHGVHLNSQSLLALCDRPLDKNYIVAASCHDLQQLRHACDIDLDFLVLSPVKTTSSHPEARPMGWQKFQELASVATIPVYALGGMEQGDIGKAQLHGGQGAAMLSGLWNAADYKTVISAGLM